MTRDPMQGLVNLVDEARQRIDAITLQAYPAPAGALVRGNVMGLFAAWDSVLATVTDLVGQIALVWQRPELTAQAKSSAVAQLVASARAASDAAVATMTAEAATIEATLVKLGQPARPGPASATQEAAIAAIKSDLTMVLDRIPAAGDVVERLAKFLSDAAANGDGLAVWVIASSGWSSLYLERFDPSAQAMFEAEVAEALDATSSGDVALARQVLEVLRGQRGLSAAIQAAGMWLKITLDDVAGRNLR